ncbi:MAG: response regulator [Gloeomargaritaceae cyanobacterium C42_A2020_066]|nr:response regulator [Gloeomargaritaceae cyanobacterium C42_A2020_066]
MGECGITKPAGQPTLTDRPADLRVLVVEDNPVNQKVFLHILHRLGYTADVAPHGRAALDALDQQPYDVVIMDVQMPEMDGLTATRHLRQRRLAGPWVIGVTASATEADRDACLAAGMNDYLTKPVRPERFRQALERYWQTRTRA